MIGGRSHCVRARRLKDNDGLISHSSKSSSRHRKEEEEEEECLAQLENQPASYEVQDTFTLSLKYISIVLYFFPYVKYIVVVVVVGKGER